MYCVHHLSTCSCSNQRSTFVFLLQEPAKASSKVVVLRASVVTLFTRSVTQGEGGDSTEDTLHLSLLKMESLVDKPPIQGPSGGGKRRISQVLYCV